MLFINFCIVGQAFQSEVQLIYNIVLISAVWQSDSIKHTHTNKHTNMFLFFRFFTIMAYHSILTIILCAIQ